ncbi:MAG: protease pro-enzyme activation domain-containing protein [Capsulimonas sp.]|uniref:S53 family peptidase n=1 Tax=Capsulimonas sp. TaxID=2494211 RepID=UPI003263FD20
MQFPVRQPLKNKGGVRSARARKLFPKLHGAAGVCAFLTLASAHSSQAQTLFGLRGGHSVHPGVTRSHSLGHMAENARLNLAISLPVRNQAALDSLLQQIYDPQSPNYHHYMTTEEYNATFAPTEAQYNTVITYLKSQGFTVNSTYGNRMIVDVGAPIANVEQTFHVNMLVYQHPTENRTFFGPDAEPALDKAIPILGVTGLDNYSLPHSNAHVAPLAAKSKVALSSAGSGPGAQFISFDFRAAYAPKATLDGAGQTVGLFQFGNYFPSDIASYCTTTGLPAANITKVLLNGVSGNPAAGENTLEQSLDIEMEHAMAPGANIRFYTGNNAADIWNQIAVENIAKQVSSSWSVSPPPSTLNQILQQMAAQGQSVFNASGDSGYSASPFGWDDNPYMTSVGGTNLSTNGGGGPLTSEDGWNGSSGYISPNFAIPSWQQGISMTANGGSTTQRNCPDVSMVATNIWCVYNNGGSGGVLGTSAASPLWAGYMALVNQQGAQHGKPTAGFINPAVYALGKGASYTTYFNDTTTGNNGKPAVTGYDLVTGWGSPKGQAMIDSLSGSANYSFVANENQSASFATPVDVAYGANSSYFYKYAIGGALTFNNATFGDPIAGVAKAGYSKPYVKSVNEGSAASFYQPIEAAYGASGHYFFNYGTTGTVTFTNAAWGGDPVANTAKAGYYMPYMECAGEGGSVTFSAPTDVAYGANGHYLFKHAVTGTVTFNTAVFGSDPLVGTYKFGYYRPSH